MDILKEIVHDHREIEDLFHRINGSQRGKHEIFNELVAKLEAHTQAEEEVLYSRVKVSDREGELYRQVMEGFEEHQIARHLIADLLLPSLTNDRWQAKLTVLREMIEHHVKEEERDLLPEAKKAFSPEEREEMGRAFSDFRAKALAEALRPFSAAV